MTYAEAEAANDPITEDGKWRSCLRCGAWYPRHSKCNNDHPNRGEKMAQTKPRKRQPLRKALMSSLDRFCARAAEESDDEVVELCGNAINALAQAERSTKAAKLRAQADALEAENGEA